jgi:hypothetical protein
MGVRENLRKGRDMTAKQKLFSAVPIGTLIGNAGAKAIHA